MLRPGPLGAGVCAECAPNAEAERFGLRPGPFGAGVCAECAPNAEAERFGLRPGTNAEAGAEC